MDHDDKRGGAHATEEPAIHSRFLGHRLRSPLEFVFVHAAHTIFLNLGKRS